MLTVNFTLPSGERISHTAAVDETLLDVALDNNVPGILGQCGGGATCCTCHCYVGEAWLYKINPPHQDELDMLVYAWGRMASSRLACQVVLGDELALDGIEVKIPQQQS